MIKISSKDWFLIGQENGWLLIKKAQMSLPENMYSSEAVSNKSTGEVITDLARDVKKLKREESSSGSIFSNIGISDMALGYLLMKKKNPGMSDAQLASLAQNLVSDKKAFLQEAVSQGMITKTQMDDFLLRNSGSISISSPTAVSKISRFKSTASRLGPFAASLAGSVGGYMATDYLAKKLKDKTRGSNVASRSVIRMRSGSEQSFFDAGNKLLVIAKKIAGISKSLDKDIGFAIESLQDLTNQIVGKPKK